MDVPKLLDQLNFQFTDNFNFSKVTMGEPSKSSKRKSEEDSAPDLFGESTMTNLVSDSQVLTESQLQDGIENNTLDLTRLKLYSFMFCL